MQGKTTTNSMDGIAILLRETHNDILMLSGKYKSLKNSLTRYGKNLYFKII